MRLSIWPNLQQPWDEVVAEVHHAEATGWHTAYVADHFMGDGGGFGAPRTPTFEALAAIAALGALTDRIRVGSLVLGNTYRHPAVVANWAATVDHQTGGRLTLGLGAGWQQNEHEQYGIDLPTPGERLDRFEEACRVVLGLLREPTAELLGEHYRLTDALCEPKPVQERLPLLIGGKGNRMMGIVARHADQWNMWGLPEVIAERSDVLQRQCELIDRDPDTIDRSTQALVMVTDDADRAREFVDAVSPRAAVAGPPERFADVVAEWQRVGVDEVIVPDSALGTGQRRAERMDALRDAVADQLD
jgi:alkanesulfonate monooxygenase SsuD/methylene tetrahydromethanopterin reductase-like flavin-dependent oxidoreductase (luciferase family)